MYFLRVLFRGTLFIFITLPLGALQFIFLLLLPPAARWLPVFYFRLILNLLGISVRVHGDPPRQGTLIVSNHISWVDILVLGAQRPAHFIAKKEVAGWPLFGQLAKLNRTIFIDRERRHQAQAQNMSIAARLEEGDCLVLFPEGTSGDGLRVLPFKSSLFAAVMPRSGELQFPVQPVSMVYTRKHGVMMGRRQRAAYGWYGDTELLPHLLFVLGASACTVELYYHTVPSAEMASHRKDLARYCEALTADGMAQILSQDLPINRKIDKATA